MPLYILRIAFSKCLNYQSVSLPPSLASQLLFPAILSALSITFSFISYSSRAHAKVAKHQQKRSQTKFKKKDCIYIGQATADWWPSNPNSSSTWLSSVSSSISFSIYISFFFSGGVRDCCCKLVVYWQLLYRYTQHTAISGQASSLNLHFGERENSARPCTHVHLHLGRGGWQGPKQSRIFQTLMLSSSDVHSLILILLFTIWPLFFKSALQPFFLKPFINGWSNMWNVSFSNKAYTVALFRCSSIKNYIPPPPSFSFLFRNSQSYRWFMRINLFFLSLPLFLSR